MNICGPVEGAGKWVVVSLLALSILATTAHPAAGDNDPDLRKALESWQKRREAIRALSYAIEGEEIIPRGKFTGDPELPPTTAGEVPPTDQVFPERLVGLLDLQNRRYRLSSRSTDFFVGLGKFAPLFGVRMFDGQTAMRFTPREQNTSTAYVPSAAQPDVWLHGETFRGPFFLKQEYPLLFNLGVFPPASSLHLDPANVSSPLDLTSLSTMPSVDFAGKRLLVVRIGRPQSRVPTTDEYWLDRDREFSVVKWTRFDATRVMVSCEIGYAADVRNIWPDHWSLDVYGSKHMKTVLMESHKLKVRSIDVNPAVAASDFQPEYKQGMVAYNVNTNTFYRVTDDKGTVEVADFRKHASTTSGVSIWLKAAVALVVLGAIGALALLVRRRLIRRAS